MTLARIGGMSTRFVQLFYVLDVVTQLLLESFISFFLLLS